MANQPIYDFGSVPLEGGPLSQAQIDANDALLDPDRMISDHQARQAAATERLNEANLRRLREENDALLSQNTKLAQESAFNAGQLAAQAQINTQQQDTMDPALEYHPDELAAHGHALPTLEKAAKREAVAMEQRIRAEMQQKHEADLAALRQETANALAAQQQAVTSVSTAIQEDFDGYIKQAAGQMGLSIAQLKADDRFMAFCSKPLAVGSSMQWGEQLDNNIQGQRKQETIAMLAEYAKHIGTAQVSQDSMEVPASSGVRPLSPQAQQNLSERQTILAKVDRLQESFIAGQFHGTQEQYQTEKRELLAKADDIPINI